MKKGVTSLRVLSKRQRIKTDSLYADLVTLYVHADLNLLKICQS